jgi:lysine 2,3-aminomutase
LIHHYQDRALVLVNDRCATYCRHCFRRHFVGSDTGRIQDDELKKVQSYLQDHGEIHEILLSGGDPLMLSEEDLGKILSSLLQVRPGLNIRIGTRVPVVLPSRITSKLVSMLRKHTRPWIIIHVNHPREITGEFIEACEKFLDNGMPVLNQAVLLKSVNDSVDILEELFRSLTKIGVKPYYLFQGDLASGTSHFRTNLKRGLAMMDELRLRLSGLSMPTFALDLPGGKGKIPLLSSSVVGEENGFYQIRDAEGIIRNYPIEDL